MVECKHSSLHKMNKFHPLLYLVFLPSVLSVGEEMICPQHKIGQNVFTCKINTSIVSQEECFGQRMVTFDFTRQNTTTTVCEASAPPNFGSKNGSTCWCDEAKQDIYSYKYVYDVTEQNMDHEGLLECKYCSQMPRSLERKNNSCKLYKLTSGACTPKLFDAVFLVCNIWWMWKYMEIPFPI